jgi:uncharacterized protein (DUF305 family)
MTTTARRRLVAAVAATALALTLAACSRGDASEGTGTDRSSTTAEASQGEAHNDADAQFAQMMIVHHEGAIEMAEVAVERGEQPEVVALGERIAAAQGPEIAQMTGWLEQWGEPGPGEMGHGGMDHGGMDMDGMDQEGAMAALDALSGADFDRRFLELMIDHHEGAVEMSEQQLEDGENADALALARTIIDAQTTEITEMRNLLSPM